MTPIPLPTGLKLLRTLPLPHKLGILNRLYGRSLAAQGVCWVQASNGVVWRLDLGDKTNRWIVFGDYERAAQMHWVRRWLRGGGLVIDSGANIGQMTLYLGPLPGVRVAAFEPIPLATDWLAECLALYPDWPVTLYRTGLSDAPAHLTLRIAGAKSTARTDWYAEHALPEIQIEVTTLDAFAEQQGIPSIRLWKLDVEGHEPEALRGTRGLLESHRIEAVLVEVSSDETIHQLTRLGYRPHRIAPDGRLIPVDATFRGNCVALPAA